MLRLAGLSLVMLLLGAAPAGAGEPVTLTVRDTVQIVPPSGAAGDDALAERLEALAWEPQSFPTTLTWAGSDWVAGEPDATVQFPSPKPVGKAAQDTVNVHWYAARDAAGEVATARAVLVVHSLHYDMAVGKAIARSFAAQGLHALLVEMPGYGRRVSPPRLPTGIRALLSAKQAVADVRRARDVVGALPHIDHDSPVALQATSLGGFVAVPAQAIDQAFSPVLLVVTGGDGVAVIEQGQKDAAIVRGHLARRGYTGEQLAGLIDPVEPLHFAARLDPDRTWLYSARFDTVIPKPCSDALAQAIGLDDAHRKWVEANHYSSVFMLPAIVGDMVKHIEAEPEVEAAAAGEAPTSAGDATPQPVNP